ncbi:MAG: hypothetical protein JWN23_991 [Rhodocyclales bacterium]|nr:hypothetical protein [Rhodocyclales bacterium]
MASRTNPQSSKPQASNITLLIAPGAIVKRGETPFCVRRFESADSVLARNLLTSIDEVVSFADITSSSAKQEVRLDLASIDPDAWEDAVEKYDYVAKLLKHPIEGRRQYANELAVQGGFGTASLYRWVDKFQKNGTITCFMRARRSDAGKIRTTEDVEAVIYDVIVSEYLTGQKKSPAHAYKELKRRCNNEKLPLISYVTFVQRIERFAPEERARRREERHKASRLEPITGAFGDLNTAMALIQIDHTRVDLEVVDSVHRIAIDRPWLTVAIDVYSRMVVGWFLSLDPPGTLGTGICIANAVLPKDNLLAKYGLSYKWPCQGKPGIVHLDNAREFRGHALKMACQEHGIDIQFRKLKKPQYGAHIERYLGTLMAAIHALPGTTFSNPRDKEDYDSAAKAALTLEELDEWLAHRILGEYHNNIHSELGCSPIKKYIDSIRGTDDAPGIGAIPIATDPERLRIDFLPYEERTVRADGIEWDKIQYQSGVLTRWIGAKEPGMKRYGRKFIVRRDPRDISTIMFYDPDLQKYFPIHYKNIAHPSISLWELAAVRRHLEKEGRKNIDEDMIFNALNHMKRIEENAVGATRALAKERERNRQRTKSVASQKNRAVPLPPSVKAKEEDDDDDYIDASKIPIFAMTKLGGGRRS